MTEVSALLLPPSTGRRETTEGEPITGIPPYFPIPSEAHTEEGRSFDRALGEKLVEFLSLGDRDQPDRLDPSMAPATPEVPPLGESLLTSTETSPVDGNDVVKGPEERGDVLPEPALSDRPEEVVQAAASVDGKEPLPPPEIRVDKVSVVKSDAPISNVENQAGDTEGAEGAENKAAPQVKDIPSVPAAPLAVPADRGTDIQIAATPARVETQPEPDTQAPAPVRGERSAEKPPQEMPAPEAKAQVNPLPLTAGGSPTMPPVDISNQTDPAPQPPALADVSMARPANEPTSIPPLPPVSGPSASHPAQQIVVAIERLQIGDRISLRLDPPDLGTVSIRLEIINGTITAIVAAERPDTVELLARHRHELGHLLADAGFSDTDTRIDLQDRDLANQRGKPFADIGQDPDEVSITVDENTDGLISPDVNHRRGMNGRLDIRV